MADEIKEVTEYLKCILTDDETREYGIELARKHTEAEALENKKKAFNDQIKADISNVAADVSGLSSKISNGYEFKDVDCEEHFDYEDETIELIRLDTGVVEKTRMMNSNDLQRRMFPKEGDKAESHAVLAEEQDGIDRGDLHGTKTEDLPEEAGEAEDDVIKNVMAQEDLEQYEENTETD